MTTKTILVTRHAEKPVDPMIPHLSEAGLARAERLVTWLPTEFGRPDFIVASSISRHSARPFETVKPLAKQLGLPIDATFSDQDYTALAHELLAAPRYDGFKVLVCWHHGHIPSLVGVLGAAAGQYPDLWDPEIYNLVLRLDYGADEKPRVTSVNEPF